MHNVVFNFNYAQCCIQLQLCTTLYSTCAHIPMFYSPCNEPVHAEYNLCLTIYSTVCSQPIHSYQQSLHKVVSNL